MAAHSNTGTVLDRILEARRAEVDHRKRVLPETALKYGVKAAPPGRDFAAALSRDALNVIAELKPASPSRGIIREPFDPPALAKSLEAAGAAALSVLTEGEFFRGSLKNLRDARKSIQLPVLRKDFIFDTWQVWETRANDADSFLLIAAALRDGGRVSAAIADGNVVVGLAVSATEPGADPSDRLLALGVAPAFRGNGLAGRLLEVHVGAVGSARTIRAAVGVAERDVVEPLDHGLRIAIARRLLERVGFVVERATDTIGRVDPLALIATRRPG
jgi:GNAT superfamily N-acetyltransferase